LFPLRVYLPAGVIGAIGRDLGQFITNSTRVQTLGDWHRPAQRQSRLL